MRKFLGTLQKASEDEDGAALVEYTVLLGIVMVTVITSVLLVGSWVGTQWVNLQATLP
jgi:pilus assembly protein Flp/PilA